LENGGWFPVMGVPAPSEPLMEAAAATTGEAIHV